MLRRRTRWLGWASAVAAGLASAPADAGEPFLHGHPPEAQPVQGRRVGPLRRLFRHTGYTIHDKFIGRPDLFIDPPVGFSVRESFAVNEARAEQHRFTLYRSDFLAGTNTLSPTGADRLTNLACRLHAWPGPLVIEWTPDAPELAGVRRNAVVALLEQAGVPVDPGRVVVGPSAYHGQLGPDAANNYDAWLYRDQLAPITYTLPPTDTSTFGSRGGN